MPKPAPRQKPSLMPVLLVLAVLWYAQRGPVVVPDVVPSGGGKLVLLIHESEADTPETARAIVSLRNPPHADTLKAGGHTLLILDPNAKNQDNATAAVLAKYKTAFDGKPLPLLLTIDKSGKVVANPVGATAGANEIMAALKANGI